MAPLIPPYRYAMIEEGVHRSAYPVDRNLRFLKRLSLKTVLSLIPQPPSGALVDFCAAHNITTIHLRVDIYKEKNPLTDDLVVQALEVLINPAKHPVLIHCMNGAEVTGIVIMCLRKLQMFSTSFATIEFSRFLREGIIEQEQTNFLESFSAEIVVPTELPLWLWQGKPLAKKHPTVRCKVFEVEAAQDANRQKAELKKKVNAALLMRSEAIHEAQEPYASLALEALALEISVDTAMISRPKPSS